MPGTVINIGYTEMDLIQLLLSENWWGGKYAHNYGKMRAFLIMFLV